MATKTLELRFIGMDSHDRPVYEDQNGDLWKDVDPRAHVPAAIYSAYQNRFDGEPDCPFRGHKTFKPRRKTW